MVICTFFVTDVLLLEMLAGGNVSPALFAFIVINIVTVSAKGGYVQDLSLDKVMTLMFTNYSYFTHCWPK